MPYNHTLLSVKDRHTEFWLLASSLPKKLISGLNLRILLHEYKTNHIGGCCTLFCAQQDMYIKYIHSFIPSTYSTFLIVFMVSRNSATYHQHVAGTAV